MYINIWRGKYTLIDGMYFMVVARLTGKDMLEVEMDGYVLGISEKRC